MNLGFVQDFGPIALLVLGALLCASTDLLAAAGRGSGWRDSRWIALGAVVLAGAASVGFWHSSHSTAPPDIEHASFLIDRFALFFYATTLGAVAAVILCTSELEEELSPNRGVYHGLILFSAAGVLFTASAADLTSIAAGLACVLFPGSLALGLRKSDVRASRMAIRSAVLTCFSLSLFIAGEALLAGLSGSTDLRDIAARVRQDDPLLVLAGVLLVVGAGSAMGSVPFSWWRAAEGRGLPLGPLLARLVLGSLAAVAALLRLLPGALGGVPASWSLTVALVAAGTLLLCPLFALRQRRLTTAVVYLFMAQLGLVLAALPEISSKSTAAILYLLLTVVPAAAGALGLAGSILVQGERDGEAELRGLWGRSPAMAAGLSLMLVALAGIPPLAGFFSRLMTVDAGLHSGYGWIGWIALASWVLIAVVVARWILVLYDSREEGAEVGLPTISALVGISLCGGATVAFAVLLGPVFAIATRGAVPPLMGP